MNHGFFQTSDEALLYYEVTGEGDAIFFVPGFAGYTRCFEKNVEALAATHKVVVFDPRGFGRSSKTNHGNTVEGHARDIKELMDYLDLKNVTLLGWSSGGQPVAAYCAQYRCARLKAAGFIDTPLHPFSPEPWNSHRNNHYAVDAWYDTFYKWVVDPRAFVDWYTNLVNPDADEEGKALIARGVTMLPYWIGLEFHYNQCRFNGAALLKDISVPVIFFTSDEANYSEQMARYYITQVRTTSKLHVHKGASHMMFYNIPEVFHEELIEFIQSIHP